MTDTLSKYVEFLDELEYDIKICIREDEKDAYEVTDGTTDILKGRIEMGKEVLGRLENFHKIIKPMKGVDNDE